MHRIVIIVFLCCFLIPTEGIAQDINIFAQFNGRYNYTAIGNTLNYEENNTSGRCETLPSSSATLNLPVTQTVIAAYLYWAGSGPGDTSVKLNDTVIDADETYTIDYDPNPITTLTYFSSYTDITDLIINEGNIAYELSELDIADVLAAQPQYCSTSTNFAGWSIYIIYEEDTLPLNQINLFQGLEIINRNVGEKVIVLDNINVLDNNGAKIGFLAWEGDSLLNFGESLSINGTVLSNPPLNPANNAFNGTNSFTGATDFYNGDLDFYAIENNIDIGDTQVEIKLTTGALDSSDLFRADLIILNNIITVLNSQLPDATVRIDTVIDSCGSRTVTVNYTVSNTNSTDPLPANTPIAFYVDNELVAQSQTQTTLPINGFEAGNITFLLPTAVENDFNLRIIVDDDGEGNGSVIEIIETNNEDSESIRLIPLPEIDVFNGLEACDVGFNSATFNLEPKLDQITQEYLSFQFYESLDDLRNDTNEILDLNSYEAQNTPSLIYIKANDTICFDIFQFELNTINCPPTVPQGFSPNNDGFNDFFKIQGLYTIFDKHELLIYNRFGTLIFKGNDALKWFGISNQGIGNQGKKVPVGTYFYVLHLNDTNYQPLTGWVYVNY